MTTYILGVIVAFVSLAIYAPVNIMDSYMSNRFRSLSLIILINSLVPLILCSILFLFGASVLPVSLLWVVLSIAVIEVFYQFPYLKAFQIYNTSSVASLFSIGKILIPVLAYFLVGEHISVWQYIGFFLIIGTSMFLTYSKDEPLKLNKAFFYMTLASTVLAVQAVLYKYLFDHINWSTGFFWTTFYTGIIAILVFLCIGKIPEFVSIIKSKQAVLITTVSNVFSWIAECLGTFAIALIPVTVAKGINSTHPLIVLGFSFIAAKYFPGIVNKPYKDSFTKRTLVIFLVMIVGVVLVTV